MSGSSADNAWNPEMKNAATESFRQAASGMNAPVIAPVRTHFNEAARGHAPSQSHDVLPKATLW